ncbi:MAG: lytic transglycosylase domain-containing protein [Nanoarchaeota archaeon]|nr:lytic transglycosylase domain-containing protein [Nanoarchaeota archaeon]
MQLMPDAARDMGLNVPDYQKVKIRNGKTLKTYSCRKGLEEKYCKFKTDERFNAEKNIDAGVKYIKWLINGLNRNKKLDPVFENILASYNAGLGNVKKYEGVPPFKETMNYVKKTCGYYEQLNAKVCYA